jgi:hypothetical protein
MRENEGVNKLDIAVGYVSSVKSMYPGCNVNSQVAFLRNRNLVVALEEISNSPLLGVKSKESRHLFLTLVPASNIDDVGVVA